jgi:PEP-CTERM motif
MKHSIGSIFGMVVGALVAFCPQVQGATIMVDWGGDYVSASQALVPTGATSNTLNSTTHVRTGFYAYDASSPNTPASGYTAPVGKSGALYGGSYVIATGTAANDPASASGTWTRQIANSASSDVIQFNRGATTNVSYQAAAFVGFLKSDFLNSGSSLPSITLDATSSLSVTTVSANSATYRFGILNGGNWYISSNTRTSIGTLSLSGAGLTGSTWGLWNPNGPATIMQDPGTVSLFDKTLADFTSIQGFGIISGFSGASGRLDISGFSVSAVPEPATIALLTLGAAVILFKRRKANA